jgi:hypothetical protein
MVLGRPKPDGTPYLNDDDTWEWLQADAAKAARFLGYLPFDQIVDQRNAEPVIRTRDSEQVEAYLTTELNVSIPEAWELEPQIDLEGFEGRQPYRLALVGEKSSLTDILGPLAERSDADLFLPTGEISDTQIYLMARAAQEDGRPLTVFYFADCDPAGWRSVAGRDGGRADGDRRSRLAEARAAAPGRGRRHQPVPRSHPQLPGSSRPQPLARRDTASRRARC